MNINIFILENKRKRANCQIACFRFWLEHLVFFASLIYILKWKQKHHDSRMFVLQNSNFIFYLKPSQSRLAMIGSLIPLVVSGPPELHHSFTDRLLMYSWPKSYTKKVCCILIIYDKMNRIHIMFHRERIDACAGCQT